jgi:HAD superfamily hydrolase (TIGR01450 family)
MAALHYLQRTAPAACLFVIGEPPLAEQLAAAHRLSEDPDQVDAVVVSVDYGFDYRKLEIAFRAIRRGARFLTTNLDRTWPTPGGLIPDTGAVVGAIEACTRRRVDAVLGKPSAWMAELALARLGTRPAETWVVGDSLESDVALGRQAGMTTALVLSGVTQREDLALAEFQPDRVLESLGDLPSAIAEQDPG